ncbi:DnaJ domain protein [Leptospira fainei serovar Hurstbridge str. BUT 6]|uniref:DnaJ domain protein n=1 Tax=Leptospira fainei serovar Hurstbridge str. BUT 6 TaxID=1193011 RepID=S3UR36_9LEPT|nr:J domain-containing protein [Leptospira fainei]EPG72866.1 DnaJ domain protein [Leptospira fainei serovar Hurstbridge str. BUT 6]
MDTIWIDHYRILGVTSDAGTETIKARFRKLAKVFHPDNGITGSSEIFLKIVRSYQILTKPDERSRFDSELRARQKEADARRSLQTFLIPPSRIIFSAQAVEFAKRGLLRAGIRNRDRRRYTGIYHDICLRLREEELAGKILAEIPLVVRVLCPECRGSDLNCGSCNGKGTYKSFRYLKWSSGPGTLVPGRIYTLDLSGFRPDAFTHFKKRHIKVKIELYKGGKK